MGKRAIDSVNRLDNEAEFFLEQKGANFNWLVMAKQPFIMKRGRHGLYREAVVNWSRATG